MSEKSTLDQTVMCPSQAATQSWGAVAANMYISIVTGLLPGAHTLPVIYLFLQTFLDLALNTAVNGHHHGPTVANVLVDSDPSKATNDLHP